MASSAAPIAYNAPPGSVAAETTSPPLWTLEPNDAIFVLRLVFILANHSAIPCSPETRITTLLNGLRIATESRLPGYAVTVGVWIYSGSRFESDATNGVAHFLGCMVFRGTKKDRLRVLVKEIESMVIT
ncbi:hypothetical protein PVL29_016091 [Vitis rotundifolia]|uniref:Peptidase M16 N-terminal domain-containing protein n=1 Tax=Vitis rotundifolia TaxID=103349 RepID=A0AA39DL22_VITRO|nr:hypothetical protein PVL29_016091 [Vitis rotundifolia]